jgi:hypothetical protein
MGRGGRDAVRVLRTFVLRLVGDELEHDRIVGRIEAAETGRSEAVHDIDALVRFLLAEDSTAPTEQWEREPWEQRASSTRGGSGASSAGS